MSLEPCLFLLPKAQFYQQNIHVLNSRERGASELSQPGLSQSLEM